MLRSKTIKVRVDDLDGTTELDSESTTFSINDRSYEIDLSPANITKLQDALAPFVAKARTKGAAKRVRTSGSSNKARTSRRRGKGPDPAKVREWAIDAGIEVGTHGRVPKAVTAQYVEAKTAKTEAAAAKKTAAAPAKKTAAKKTASNPSAKAPVAKKAAAKKTTSVKKQQPSRATREIAAAPAPAAATDTAGTEAQAAQG